MILESIKFTSDAIGVYHIENKSAGYLSLWMQKTPKHKMRMVLIIPPNSFITNTNDYFDLENTYFRLTSDLNKIP